MINNYEREKISFNQEISHLKNEIHTLTSQLNDKNSHFKNLSEKLTSLEQILKEKDENMSKTNQELLVKIKLK